MSESPAAPTEMTREELEEEVVEMRAEITELNDSSQQMQKDIAFLKKTLITLTDADLGDDMGVMDLPKHGKHLRSDIENLQSVVNHHSEQLAAVSDVSQKKTEKEAKSPRSPRSRCSRRPIPRQPSSLM